MTHLGRSVPKQPPQSFLGKAHKGRLVRARPPSCHALASGCPDTAPPQKGEERSDGPLMHRPFSGGTRRGLIWGDKARCPRADSPENLQPGPGSGQDQGRADMGKDRQGVILSVFAEKRSEENQRLLKSITGRRSPTGGRTGRWRPCRCTDGCPREFRTPCCSHTR